MRRMTLTPAQRLEINSLTKEIKKLEAQNDKMYSLRRLREQLIERYEAAGMTCDACQAKLPNEKEAYRISITRHQYGRDGVLLLRTPDALLDFCDVKCAAGFFKVMSMSRQSDRLSFESMKKRMKRINWEQRRNHEREDGIKLIGGQANRPEVMQE